MNDEFNRRAGEQNAEALMSALTHMRRRGATRAEVRSFTDRVSGYLETRSGAPTEMRELLGRAGEIVHGHAEDDPDAAARARRRFLDLL